MGAPEGCSLPYLYPVEVCVGGPRKASMAAHVALCASGPRRSVQSSPSSCRTDAPRLASWRCCLQMPQRMAGECRHEHGVWVVVVLRLGP